MYMEFPQGFKVPGGVDRKAFVLKLHRNLYGQKQTRRVWYKYLHKRLITKAGFVQSKHDECLFFQGKVMYALYIDDSILGAPTRQELDKAIQAIKDAKLQITLEGDLADFLGVKIKRKNPKENIFTQPHLIDDILNDLGLKHAKDGKETPAASSRILTRNDNGNDHDKSFHYRSVIGKIELSGKGNETRYLICHSPMCPLCCRPQEIPCTGSKMVRTLSITFKKERYSIQGRYYTWLRSIRRCIICRELG